MLISHRSDVNAVDHYGLTPLHLAGVSRVSERTINLLVQHGANLDAQDHNGNTPLHLAARHGLQRAVQQFVRAGCSLNLRNHQGETALHQSVKRILDREALLGGGDIVRCLVLAGADTQLVDNNQRTALDILREHGACYVFPETAHMLQPDRHFTVNEE